MLGERLRLLDRQRIALLGLPFDHRSSHLRGPAEAPPLIRAALVSDAGNPWSETGVDVSDPGLLADLGDLEATPETAHAAVEAAVREVCAAGLAPLSLGGDHSVTFPVLRALAAARGPLNVLHVDAHPDLYDEFDGDRLSHACPFARIMEEGLASRLVQVGVRTLNPHQRDQAERFGVDVVTMRDRARLERLVLDGPLYVSIDLDGLDPACAPGVSHPEPGGLQTRDVLDLLHRQEAPLVGADVVEYNPHRDVHGLTARVAAKLVKELAAMAAVSPTERKEGSSS